MKNKQSVLILLLTLIVPASQAQVLKKLKDKVVSKIENEIDKSTKKVNNNTKPGTGDGSDANPGPAKENDTPGGATAIKVFSKFDFIPGKTVIYYDDFENDNIGETPAGWLTSNLSEVVSIEGKEGKWIKLLQKSAAINIIRNKKQSWGDNFTVEFDVFLDPDQTETSDLYIMLANSGGSMVTDESLITDLPKKEQITIMFRLEKDGTTYDFSSSRSSGQNSGDNTRFIDRERLSKPFKQPVHISMAVTGKRFRFWFNDKKLLDVNNGVRPEAIPNLLAFSAHYNTNARFYLSNIRIARDVPDTRAGFTQGKIISNLLFYTGTAEMRPESMGALKEISAVLKEATEPVKIVGHTDSDGEDAANLKLSQQRAETVKQLLIKEFGLSEDKLQTEGRGETQPVADNRSAEGKAQNRRVEFIIKAEADNYKGYGGAAGKISSHSSEDTKSVSSKSGSSTASTAGEGLVKLQSKMLNTSFPYAFFMKAGSDRYKFVASKEEGNNKDDFFEIELNSITDELRAGTYTFKEAQVNSGKQLNTIAGSKARLYYDVTRKDYIQNFVPFIANGHKAGFYSEGLDNNLPKASPHCKLVIEKVGNGKVSGYFLLGTEATGFKPVKKGDAMTMTFSTGFLGEMKAQFSNVPLQ